MSLGDLNTDPEEPEQIGLILALEEELGASIPDAVAERILTFEDDIQWLKGNSSDKGARG